MLNKVKGSANLDVATGLNYRYKHSKYSVGISIPLIQRKASVVSSDGDYTNSFVFNEGALLRCFLITSGCFEREMD